MSRYNAVEENRKSEFKQKAAWSTGAFVVVCGLVWLVAGCANGGKIPHDQCERACGGPARVALAQVACKELDEGLARDFCMHAPVVAQEECLLSCEKAPE